MRASPALVREKTVPFSRAFSQKVRGPSPNYSSGKSTATFLAACREFHLHPLKVAPSTCGDDVLIMPTPQLGISPS